MARRRKTHINSPTRPRESLCGRTSVTLAERDSAATCKNCRILSADGTLELEQYEKGDTRFNNKGTPRLTEMQKAFAAHPGVTTNARQAALDVGYSPSFAKSQAVALRKQVSSLIMQNQERAKKRSAISVARVQTELAAMGFANIVDYFNVAESGKVTPKQLNELTREQSAAIQEVKILDVTNEETGEVTYVIGFIKLADKRANLVELGKTLGMFNKVQVDDKRQSTLDMNEIPTGALEDAEKLLMEAVLASREEKAKRKALPGKFEEIKE